VLIRKVDGATDEEWRSYLADDRHRFGELIAGGGPDRAVPVVVPTHFLFDGDATIRLHLAVPNPVFDALDENPVAMVSVIGDVTYIPTNWSGGIPTSYYAAVQCIGRTTVLDDPEEVAEILRLQLAAFQPEGGYDEMAVDHPLYGPRFKAIRGVRLDIDEVRAKFKFGGNKSPEQQAEIAVRLAERDGPGDAAARAHLLRRAGGAGGA
jgi:transcriptional regulator